MNEVNHSYHEGDTLEDLYYPDLRTLEAKGLVDISSQASWLASSEKPEHGVELITDDSPHTFWQSDATLPHILTMKFSKRVVVSQVSVFVSIPHDESYTPSIIALYAGTGIHDLVMYGTWDLVEPNGWCHIPFNVEGKSDPIKCFHMKLVILGNHQKGKDSHIRSIKIFTQRPILEKSFS